MSDKTPERVAFEAWLENGMDGEAANFSAWDKVVAWLAWHAATAQSCAGCSKQAADGWALYCVACAEQIAAPFKPDWVNYRQGVADGRYEALEEAAKLVDEYGELRTAEKDAALLVGGVDLSNAISGEPRAAYFLAAAIRALKGEGK